MTYCFRCLECGWQGEFASRDTPLHTCAGGATVVRDWKRENAAPATLQLKREREAGGRTAIRDLFLPKQEDFADASDPEGEKGMQGWLEEHGPKDSNKSPLYPDHKRKSF